MSVLSDEKLKEAYWDGFYSDGASTTDGLRAVADAAISADRAARAEPVGQLCESVYGRGQVLWFEKPSDGSLLYTATPAATVVPTHIMDAAFRLRQQGIMGAADAQLVILEWILAAAHAPSQEPTEPASDQIAAAVKAERERIYALIDTNPEHIWRDAGFAQWRERRAKEQQQ